MVQVQQCAPFVSVSLCFSKALFSAFASFAPIWQKWLADVSGCESRKLLITEIPGGVSRSPFMVNEDNASSPPVMRLVHGQTRLKPTLPASGTIEHPRNKGTSSLPSTSPPNEEYRFNCCPRTTTLLRSSGGAGWLGLPPIDTRKTRWEYHWDTGRRGMTPCI